MLVVAAVIVFVIAAVVIGRESHRLDAVAPRTVYVFEEAVDYVADHLPEASQARLTRDEVARLLRWHMAVLREKGLLPPEVVDRRQDIDAPVVIEDVGVVGALLAEPTPVAWRSRMSTSRKWSTPTSTTWRRSGPWGRRPRIRTSPEPATRALGIRARRL